MPLGRPPLFPHVRHIRPARLPSHILRPVGESQGGFEVSVPKESSVVISLPISLNEVFGGSDACTSVLADGFAYPYIATKATTSSVTIKSFYKNSGIGANWIVIGK